MRTARDNRLPPSLWLAADGSPSVWTMPDRLLLLALTAYEDNLCSCGQPKDKAWSPETPGAWDVRQVHCAACAELDASRTDKPEPGVKHYVVHEAPPG